MAGPCPVTGCTEQPRPGNFMCRQHWFGTPKPLRDEVWRTWRIVDSRQHRAATPEQRLHEINDYRGACAAAAGYWNEETSAHG